MTFAAGIPAKYRASQLRGLLKPNNQTSPAGTSRRPQAACASGRLAESRGAVGLSGSRTPLMATKCSSRSRVSPGRAPTILATGSTFSGQSPAPRYPLVNASRAQSGGRQASTS